MTYPLSKRIQLYCFAIDAIILFPFLAFFARVRARRNGARAKIAPRILVVPILTRVGDLVCSTPVFREIKRAYPHAHLAVAVGQKAKGILAQNPRIDDLIDYNDERFHGWVGRARFYRCLFSKEFDAVISLGSSVVGTLAGIFSASPVRAKITVTHPPILERLTDWMNTRRFCYTTGTFLQRKYLSTLSAIGIDALLVPVIKEVFPTEAGEKKAHAFLEDAFGAIPPLLVGITVSAGNKIKEWPTARFAELADALVENYNARIIFIDSASNASLVASTQKYMKHARETAAATHFSLEELPALIKQLSAFIAVDTGTIYIAHALGIPLVDMVGPVHPDEQPPSDERSVQVRPAAGIAPTSFVLAANEHNGNHMRAVLSITAPQVLAAFESLIARGCIAGVPSLVYAHAP